MIAGLRGLLESFAADHAVIDVNGVYYLVFASTRTLATLGAIGEAEAVKLGWKPQNETVVAGDDAATLMKLIDALEEDDDVQTVWGNYEMSEDVMERLA